MLYVNPILSADAKPDLHGQENPARRKAALQELEHYFVFQLMQEMRKTVPDSGLLEGGSRREMFEEMLDDAYAGAIAESGQIGLARQMEQQLEAAQPKSSGPLPSFLDVPPNVHELTAGMPLPHAGSKQLQLHGRAEKPAKTGTGTSGVRNERSGLPVPRFYGRSVPAFMPLS